MDIKAKVHEIGPVIEVSEKFKKRELIVEYAENPTYPEYVKFEANQDKVSLFDGLKVGQSVEVFFNLRGRPWTDKNGKTSYFNTLNAWKVNAGEVSNQPAPQVAQAAGPAEDDDLPF